MGTMQRRKREARDKRVTVGAFTKTAERLGESFRRLSVALIRAREGIEAFEVARKRP